MYIQNKYIPFLQGHSFVKNYEWEGVVKKKKKKNADSKREMLEQSCLPYNLHQTEQPLLTGEAWVSPAPPLCADTHISVSIHMHVFFPLRNHHLIIQTLPLTAKKYIMNEEMQASTTL